MPLPCTGASLSPACSACFAFLTPPSDFELCELLCNGCAPFSGRADFDGLHSRQHNDEVQFYAFDVLMSDGDDLRKLPLSMRKASLARLLARRVNGIFLSDFERGEIGPDLFRHACMLGLEGLVSKRNDRPYRASTSPNWVKVKNPEHPAMARVKDAFR